MSRISIIVPSNRVGGVDVLFEGLRHQTWKDFQVIFVDCLYDLRRGEAFDEMTSDLPFPVLHLPPRRNTFPVPCFQSCMNTGLSRVDSEFVLFTCDYAFFEPHCLEKHIEAHRGHHHAVVGAYAHLTLPALHAQFPRHEYAPKKGQNTDDPTVRQDALNSASVRYLRDLKAGRLSPFMTSTFAHPLKKDDVPPLDVTHVSSYVRLPAGPTIPGVSNLKNDSFRLNHIINVNGFDEDFDGAHYYQDYEFAERIHRSGVQFFLEPSAAVFILDMHEHMTIRTIRDGDARNQALYEQKQKPDNVITEHGLGAIPRHKTNA